MDFRQLLAAGGPILLDGAMGTELDRRGLPSRLRANLDHPETVVEIHREYLRAGCQVLLTNTLTMNRIYLQTHRLGVDVAAVNLAGARLARQAADSGQCVLGNLTATGQLLEPYGTLTGSEACDAFREQAGCLAEGGVDGFIIETMYDLREALCAVRACKELALPVIASMAFTSEQKGGRTVMGDPAADCARQLADAGADVVGANCGDLDPAQMAVVVTHLQEATPLPVLAEPNAGKPQLIAGQTLFSMEPGPFAEGVAACHWAGARLVGGCCGTTPDHIRAVARKLAR